MLRHARQAVAPLYLFLCLLLGGSAQGIWANAFLQLVGLVLITWAAVEPADEPLTPTARQLLILSILAIALVLIQLIPLPASLWTHLGGRRELGSDYSLLGLKTPAMPVSLTPYRTVNSLLGMIPPVAIICTIVRLKASRGSWLAAALIAGTIAGVLLGALQVGAGTNDASPWYLYPDTNVGLAVGFFANANHMADLLVITLPFLAAMLAAARNAKIQHLSALIAIVVGAGLVILVGIALNQSIAGYGLVAPVLLASIAIVLPARSRLRLALIGFAAILFVAAVVLIADNAANPTALGAGTSVQTRAVMLRTTLKAIANFMPLGSGLGSFPSVYPLYETPALVDSTIIVHAHNDYAELVLELGIPGLVLLAIFFAWWAVSAWRLWRSTEVAPFARAAAVATAAILLHSIVDFPLRTAAIATVFAFCLALLADRRAPPPRDPGELRPTRHFELR